MKSLQCQPCNLRNWTKQRYTWTNIYSLYNLVYRGTVEMQAPRQLVVTSYICDLSSFVTHSLQVVDQWKSELDLYDSWYHWPVMATTTPPHSEQPYIVQPMQPSYTSTTVGTQPGAVVHVSSVTTSDFGPDAKNMFCPYCQASILTGTRCTNGTMTWLIAGVICCAG